MKFLTELDDHGEFEYIVEQKENLPKIYKLRGKMIQAEGRNRNNRYYKEEIIEPEIGRYVSQFVKDRRAFGDLGHPQSPVIEIKNASHIITELHYDKDSKYGIGELEVLDTPMGKILKTVMEAKCRLGVSTRGVGSLQENNVVGPDFKLIAIDVVANESGVGCVVDSVYENKEYIIDGSGNIVEMAVETLTKDLSKHGSRQLAEDLSNFISQLRRKI